MNELGGHFERSDEIAAFVLEALEPAEAEELQSHLQQCAGCRDEYQRLRVAADALPLAVPQYKAPAVVGQRLMTIVRSEAQLLRAAEGSAPPPAGRRLRWLPPWFGGAPVLAFSTVAAAIVAIAVLALAGVFSGPSTASRTLRGQVVGVPGASVLLRVSNGRGELFVSHMVQPPSGRIYEMWLQRPGRPPQPTAVLFGVTRAGGANVTVPGSLTGIQHVLVTAEPLGGSEAPTRAPVIIVPATGRLADVIQRS